MNELQQVLLGIAILVIAGIYFVSKRKVKTEQTTQQADEAGAADSKIQGRQQANQALGELSEPHIPVSPETEQRLMPSTEADVTATEAEPQAQMAFESLDQTETPAISEVDATRPNNKADSETSTGPKHIVIEDPDMVSIQEAGGMPAEDYTPNFGRPESSPSASSVPNSERGEKTEPEAFVIIVMSTGEVFDMAAVNHALLGVGLSFDAEQKLYVKQDTMGNSIITVANLLDPGTFPEGNYEQFATPGVVLILQLPTTVKAPRAMHDLIMMSRKISQRLNGRLYNMERQLMKESDLQAMRDAAIAYETQPA